MKDESEVVDAVPPPHEEWKRRISCLQSRLHYTLRPDIERG